MPNNMMGLLQNLSQVLKSTCRFIFLFSITEKMNS